MGLRMRAAVLQACRLPDMYAYANIMYVPLKEVYADTPKKFGEALRIRRLIRG